MMYLKLWSEAVIVWLQTRTIYLQGARKTTKKESRSPGRDLNPGPVNTKQEG
jgi:hypothetical protein